MKDILDELTAVTRATGTTPTPAGNGRFVKLSRTYPAPIEDVWDALTSAERLPRWFLPVSGDLRLGGRFQFEGNTGGEILQCEPPTLLRVSWEMGGGFSEVVVRLTTVSLAGVDDGTRFELEHTATGPDELWSQFGPGAVGVGWDGALLGLALYLTGREPSTPDKAAFPFSDAGREFNTVASRAWGEAALAAGTDPAAVEANVAATTAFYVPPLP